MQTHKYNGKEFDTTHGMNMYDYGARQYNSLVDRCQYFFGNIYGRISFLKFEIMNKKKTLIYSGILMIVVWIIAIVHGLHSMSNQQIPDCEIKRSQLSSFIIVGDIISTKYLYSNHGYKHLIILRPTTIEIYKRELSKHDPFWGIYDKKKNLVYFVLSYWDSSIEKQVWKNVKIDSWKEYDIEMTNKFEGNLFQLPDSLVQYENENTIRL